MLISHLNKFIYTKTSQTASTSVESYFETFCMPEGEWKFQHARKQFISATGIIGYRGSDKPDTKWFNHMSATAIKAQLGETKWNEYFKFTVMRNPFDRLVSRFFFVEQAHGTRRDLIAYFREWVLGGGAITDRHTYTIGGQICLDYFIRFENLEKGIKQVCKHLEIPFDPNRLPRLKTVSRDKTIPLEAFYDDRTIRIVREKYAFELSNFGYSLAGA